MGQGSPLTGEKTPLEKAKMGPLLLPEPLLLVLPLLPTFLDTSPLSLEMGYLYYVDIISIYDMYLQSIKYKMD